MTDKLEIEDIYEQNLNFLFGAGASFGFLPTLALKIKDQNGKRHTFETLAKKFENDKNLTKLLFMAYYQQCIKPGLVDNSSISPDKKAQKDEVIKNYKTFIETLVHVLEKQPQKVKKANIFTTNYDNCFETASEELLNENVINFIANDGSTGFQSKTFHIKNFNQHTFYQGLFDKYQVCIPQINILHPHGSINWEKSSNDIIKVSYERGNIIEFPTDIVRITSNVPPPPPLSPQMSMEIIFKYFIESLNDESKTDHDLLKFKHYNLDKYAFFKEYHKIAIVNPTKWKFHETVFEEAYYQILRHLSYELERPNSTLIVFGFSFADEHIRHLIQRSLSNPSLTVYIACYDSGNANVMKSYFQKYNNVKYICTDTDQDKLNFNYFNQKVFNINNGGN